MSEESIGSAEQKAREQREADLVAVRLKEIRENPIQGNFDLGHLKKVHAYIFQDLPEYKPGVIRERTEDAWIKHRALEGRPGVYDVYYANQGIEDRIKKALHEFGGADAIKGLAPDAAATRAF